MNVLLIGDQFTGKTSFVNRLIDNSFFESYITTIGKELHHYNYNGQKIFIHDCGGGDRYYSMIELYFKTADGFIIFYNDEHKNIEKWTGMVPETTPFILVKNGGKMDDIQDVHIDTKLNKNIQKPIDLILKKIPKKTIEEQTLINLVFEYIMSFFPIFN